MHNPSVCANRDGNEAYDLGGGGGGGGVGWEGRRGLYFVFALES